MCVFAGVRAGVRVCVSSYLCMYVPISVGPVHPKALSLGRTHQTQYPPPFSQTRPHVPSGTYSRHTHKKEKERESKRERENEREREKERDG